MDSATEKHLANWLDNVEYPDYREESERIIRKVIEEYPELLNTHSWLEILKLGESRYS